MNAQAQRRGPLARFRVIDLTRVRQFADWHGDYRAGFTLLAALAGVGSLLFLMARPPK